MEPGVQRLERLLLQPDRIDPGASPEPGHHRHAAIHGRLHDHTRARQPGLVQPPRHLLEGRLGRQQLLEAHPTPVAGNGRHDQAPDCVAGVVRGHRNTSDTRDLGGRLSRDLLEVLGGHGTVTCAEEDGTPDLGRLDVLAIDAAVGGLSVLHSRHVGDG